MELIGKQAAIEAVKEVCREVLKECGSHFDTVADGEVYDDMLEVDAIVKCNERISAVLRDMEPAQPEQVCIAKVTLTDDQVKEAFEAAVKELRETPLTLTTNNAAIVNLINLAAHADEPIEELNLSVRAYRCLRRSGIFTITQVCKAIENGNIKRVRALGNRSISEVEEKLTEYFKRKATE